MYNCSQAGSLRNFRSSDCRNGLVFRGRVFNGTLARGASNRQTAMTTLNSCCTHPTPVCARRPSIQTSGSACMHPYVHVFIFNAPICTRTQAPRWAYSDMRICTHAPICTHTQTPIFSYTLNAPNYAHRPGPVQLKTGSRYRPTLVTLNPKP